MPPVEYTPSDKNEYSASGAGAPPGGGWRAQSCGWCGEQAFEEGFIEESGQGARGRARWVEGPLEIGIFGGTALMGKPRRDMVARRCTNCGHLEFFTTDYS